MHMKLQMKMTQQLIMTPQLQQAIKLLQLSRAELEELIDQSLIENPVLEESMDIDTYPSEEQRDMTTEKTEVPVSEETHETAREEEKEETTAQEEVDWQQYVEQVDQYGQYQDRRIRSGGDDDELPSLEATLAQDESLQDHLLWQVGMLRMSKLEVEVAHYLAGNIADNGYLVTSIREILEGNPELQDRILEALDSDELTVEREMDDYWMDLRYQQEKAAMGDGKRKSRRGKNLPPPPVFEEEELEEDLENKVQVSRRAAAFVEEVLFQIQTFDPNGVGARSLQECLLIQLRLLGRSDELCYRIVEQDMELLECKDLKRIARRQKQDLERVLEAYREIMALEPKPGRSFTPPPFPSLHHSRRLHLHGQQRIQGGSQRSRHAAVAHQQLLPGVGGQHGGRRQLDEGVHPRENQSRPVADEEHRAAAEDDLQSDQEYSAFSAKFLRKRHPLP